MTVPDPVVTTDGEALDALADLFRLPEWSIGDSWCDFIDCCANIVMQRRDITLAAPPDLLAVTGHA